VNVFDVQCSELPIGAHLVAPRGEYEHHGIYVGAGRVVHYSGFCEQARRGPVEEVSLTRFAAGREIRVKAHAGAHYSGQQIVARARSRLGEDRYRLLTNNCEHFCTWCVVGRSRSEQVRRCLLRPGVGLRTVTALLKVFCARRLKLARAWAPPRVSVSEAGA
jgi:hypothetical protein